MTEIIHHRQANPKGRLLRLWNHREAVQALVSRQFKARFEKPVIGLIWMLIQPLVLAGLFAVFFGALVRVPSGDIPYPAFVFVGVALWQGVQRALSESASMFDSAAPLLRQTSLPRLAPVLANIAGAAIDVVIALLVAIFIGWLFGVKVGMQILITPVFLALALFTATGLSAALGGLCGAWRDLRQMVPLGLQILMFASPVIYPSSLIPEKFQYWYAINPFAGILDGLRWTLLSGPAPDLISLGISTASSLVCLAFGLWIFFKLEGRAADAL